MIGNFRSTGANIALALSVTLSGCAVPNGQRHEAEVALTIVHDASLALQTAVNDGGRPGLANALHGACAVLVFPHLRGGGFIAGGSRGTGVLMARDPDRTRWVGPAFFSLSEVTLGPEIALGTRELVVVFRHCDALGPLKGGARTFSLRTSLATQSAEQDAGLAAGPDVRAFARTKGAVVGLSVHVIEVKSEVDLTAACCESARPPGRLPGDQASPGSSLWALQSTMERLTK